MRTHRWLGFVVVLAGCSDVPAPPTHVSQRIPLIGGEPDTSTRGVVGLVVGEASGCTGSLIAPNLVLTARHCVASINSSDGTVQCGVTNFGQNFPVSDFVVTPDDNLRNGVPVSSQFSVERIVTPSGSGVCGNDVSLLILSTSIPASQAPLLVPRVDAAVTAREPFDAVGYGITNPNDVQGQTFGERLRVDGLDVLCVGTACTTLGGTRTEWGAVTPVCSGDSGGPALDAEGRVIGVASRGNVDCESALYGSVAAWKSLIVDTAKDAASSGGYPPPSWTDGTSMDAGATDAGTTDAGTTDAGTTDAGTTDAGMTDAGMTDAGTTDAGTTDAGTTDAGTTEPDGGMMIGEPCAGQRCGDDLACYLAEDDDIGVCVPRCSADVACPRRYSCSSRLDVCVPNTPPPSPEPKSQESNGDDGGCGCRAAVRPDGRGTSVLAFLLLASVARRRRRRAV